MFTYNSLHTQLYGEGKEFIIINIAYQFIMRLIYRDYFLVPQLLNRCVNFDCSTLSLTTLFDILYVIDLWLLASHHVGRSFPSSFILVYIHSPRCSFYCELIASCYWLWKNEVYHICLFEHLEQCCKCPISKCHCFYVV